MPFTESCEEGDKSLADVGLQVDELTRHVSEHGQTVGVQVLVLGVRHVELHHLQCHQYKHIA